MKWKILSGKKSIMPLVKRWLQFLQTVTKYFQKDLLLVERNKSTFAESLRKTSDNTVKISPKNFSKILILIYLENSISHLKKTMAKFVIGLGSRSHKFMRCGKRAKKWLKFCSLNSSTLKLITAASKMPLYQLKIHSSQTCQKQTRVVKLLQLYKEAKPFLSEVKFQWEDNLLQWLTWDYSQSNRSTRPKIGSVMTQLMHLEKLFWLM